MPYLIEARNLIKKYSLGEVEISALRGVSLNVNEGELISIIGPSGSGKSTMMHILGCLDTPTSGEYLLDGENVSKLNDAELAKIRNQKIGFVFQTFNLLPHLTVLENVLLPVQYTPSADIRKARERATELLEQFGLENRVRNRPTQLSGGEMQRVAIARALINNPKILLADEPTGNLDSKTGLEILKIFKELHKEGMTEIIVTHDLNITKFTERIIRIKDGLIDGDEVNKVVLELEEEGI
ncbi:MAG: ABC transporter ATP-binding protein [Candidatus Atribacteria bacterium]|nr:ABC transporter ATP-binding protein [Candidatus Atribacteria bacterium]